MQDRVTFTGDSGVHWTIYPVRARHVVHNDELVEHTPAHLCFEAQVGDTTLLRRVEEYPDDWSELEAGDLVRLSTLEGLVETALQHEETSEVRRGIAQLGT